MKQMNFYFAPMEGVTGYIYRNAHRTFFGDNIEKYFSPFINANLSESFKSKELNDILPENNEGVYLVPQIMSNRANEFVHTSKKLRQLGYDEINLNLGCPSKTVVTKGRGSGFLAKKRELNEFLESIFENQVTQISIKTRLGIENPEEFYELIEIFNRFPLKELIIHPRVQKDFYKNKPNLNVFLNAFSQSKNKVCYNGDIFQRKDYYELTVKCPEVSTWMLGRGLLSNPSLIQTITNQTKLDKKLLKEFHDKIYKDYQGVLYGEKNVLFKMKELWYFMIPIFSNHEKYAKKIKKVQSLSLYEDIVSNLFREQRLLII